VWPAWDAHSELGETTHRVSQALGQSLDEASVRLLLRRFYRAGLIERPACGSESSRETRRPLGRRVALRRAGGRRPRGSEHRGSISRAGGSHVPAKRPNLFAHFPVLQFLLPGELGPLRRRQAELRSPLTRVRRELRWLPTKGSNRPPQEAGAARVVAADVANDHRRVKWPAGIRRALGVILRRRPGLAEPLVEATDHVSTASR
jgi:hypothetical protein